MFNRKGAKGLRKGRKELTYNKWDYMTENIEKKLIMRIKS